MPMTVEMLQEEIFALPNEARERLAISILDSLDAPPSPYDAMDDDDFSAEMSRRVEDIQTGRVETISYEEARRRVSAITRG